MFTTQTGAKFDLKEDQLENVFSKHGKVVKHKIYQKVHMGFDGFVGKWLPLFDCCLTCTFRVLLLPGGLPPGQHSGGGRGLPAPLLPSLGEPHQSARPLPDPPREQVTEH